MFDGVKLAPSCDGQHDKANPSGNSKAKTDIDEGQQPSLGDNQSLKQCKVPRIWNARPVASRRDQGGKILQDSLHCRVQTVCGVQQARRVYGHPLIDQDRGRRYPYAGPHLAKKKIRTSCFILEAPIEGTCREQRDPWQ